MAAKRLTDEQRKERDEKSRWNFAKFMRAKPAELLGRISAAYQHAFDLSQVGVPEATAFNKALRNQNLSSYVIGRTPLSYKQARIVYEMIVLGKYIPSETCAPSKNLQSDFQIPEHLLPPKINPRHYDLENMEGVRAYEDARIAVGEN